MNEKHVLMSYMDVCNLHAERLRAALLKVKHLAPFTQQKLSCINEIDAAFLEVVTTRFAKLQDTCGQKLFPLVLTCSGEDITQKTFIDILNMFEKFGFIKSAYFWMRLRQTRNAIAHEYPDNLEKLAVDVNTVYLQSYELLDYWDLLKEKIKDNVLLITP